MFQTDDSMYHENDCLEDFRVRPDSNIVSSVRALNRLVRNILKGSKVPERPLCATNKPIVYYFH